MRRLKTFLIGFLFFILNLISQINRSDTNHTNLDKYQIQPVELACNYDDSMFEECE